MPSKAQTATTEAPISLKRKKPSPFFKPGDKRAALLNDLREKKEGITSAQKKEIYESIKTLISEVSFNQMLKGDYVSLKNLKLIKAIIKKVEAVVKQNEEAMESLGNKKIKAAKA